MYLWGLATEMLANCTKGNYIVVGTDTSRCGVGSPVAGMETVGALIGWFKFSRKFGSSCNG
jgi:hypothetical protein